MMWEDKHILQALIVGIIVGAMLAVASFYVTKSTYKQGQIDALTGKVKYRLITLPDSTSQWVRK